MNWGEIQIESLKKMFLNNDNILATELETLKSNKKYKTYLFAMPQACNEAIRKILSVKPTIKSYSLKRKMDTNKYELKKIIPKYKRFYEITSEYKNPSYHLEGDNVLVFDDKNNENIYTIYYEAYHELIKLTTTNSTQIDLDRESTTIIPLYIAAELYKDDDIQQSTIYMNEFESALQEMRQEKNELISNPREITTIFGVDW